mgnify:CR=1 FL=1
MREDDIFPYKKCLCFMIINLFADCVIAQIYLSEFNKICRGRHCLPEVKAEIFKYDFTGGNARISYCLRIDIIVNFGL